MKPAAPFAVFTAIALLAVGCKGDTTYKDSKETLAKLAACTKQVAEKDKLIQQYADRIATLERESAQSGEIVVSIEGDALTVKSLGATSGTSGPPVDEKTAAAMSQDFLDQVGKSRGAIQKCYEQALKKNTGLQARTVTIKLSATFAATGLFQRTSFNSNLGDTFDACLRSVASRWKLKPASQPMTFQAQVSLVPA